MIKRLFAIVALVALAGRPSFAQVDRATLSGVVRDTAGAAVPGATVSALNLATNVSVEQQTTDTGSFRYHHT